MINWNGSAGQNQLCREQTFLVAPHPPLHLEVLGVFGPSKSMCRGLVAILLGIEPTISSLSILRRHSSGSGREAMSTAARPSRVSAISKRPTALRVSIGVVMRSSMMSNCTRL